MSNDIYTCVQHKAKVLKDMLLQNEKFKSVFVVMFTT